MDKKYYIFVGDEKIEVDQEVYKATGKLQIGKDI